eukprot:gene13462-9270_t
MCEEEKKGMLAPILLHLQSGKAKKVLKKESLEFLINNFLNFSARVLLIFFSHSVPLSLFYSGEQNDMPFFSPSLLLLIALEKEGCICGLHCIIILTISFLPLFHPTRRHCATHSPIFLMEGGGEGKERRSDEAPWHFPALLVLCCLSSPFSLHRERQDRTDLTSRKQTNNNKPPNYQKNLRFGFPFTTQRPCGGSRDIHKKTNTRGSVHFCFSLFLSSIIIINIVVLRFPLVGQRIRKNRSPLSKDAEPTLTPPIMAPLQHLSDLCQGDSLEPVISYLRQRVRGPSGQGALETTRDDMYGDLMAFQDDDGRTALHWAIALRNYSMTEQLLRPPYQAAALTWDQSGTTPFLTAVTVGAPVGLVKLLLDRSVAEYPQCMAALGAEEEEEEKTEGEGARCRCPLPRLQGLRFEHPVPTASSSHPPAAEAQEKQVEEETAERERIVRAILNAKDELGNTPLLSAASRGNLELVSFLLDSGADVAVQNRLGQTVLHRAVSKSNYNLVEALVLHSERVNGGPKSKEHRVFVNIPDKRGDTALFYASMENDEEIGSFLLQHGANRDLKNKDGKHFYEM